MLATEIMITKFVNRNDELEFLEKKYKEKSAQHIIIYLICPNGGLAKKATNDALFNFYLISWVVYFILHSN
jgi:AAA+ ATPase superfamily predicted ATPase